MPDCLLKIVRSYLIILLLLVSGQQIYVSAATYYISPAGNDGGNGTTTTTPWKTIAKINTVNFVAGDEILFEGGQTFTGGILFDDQDVGTASQPIIVSSYGTGRAIIEISTPNTNGIYVSNAARFRITDLIFKGAGGTSGGGINFYSDLPNNEKSDLILIENVEVSGFYYGISIGGFVAGQTPGFTNVSITKSEIYDIIDAGIFVFGTTGLPSGSYSNQYMYIAENRVYNVPGNPAITQTHTGSGILVGGTDGAVIERNVVYNGGTANNYPPGGPYGIWTYDSNKINIQYNEVYNWSNGTGGDGGAFDLDGGTSNSVLQYNYSHDNEGPAFLAGNFENSARSFGNAIRYNISERDATDTRYAAITLFNAPGRDYNGLDIYNNTIYMSETSAAGFTDVFWGGNIKNVEVYNNIFYSTSTKPMVKTTTQQNEFNFTNNLYFTTAGTYSYDYKGTIYNSLADWQAGENQEKDGNTLVGFEGIDPQLNAPGTGGLLDDAYKLRTLKMYQLKPTSPAIDKGLNLNSKFSINTGSIDFFGQSNLTNNKQDLGAHEFSGAENCNCN